MIAYEILTENVMEIPVINCIMGMLLTHPTVISWKVSELNLVSVFDRTAPQLLTSSCYSVLLGKVLGDASVELA